MKGASAVGKIVPIQLMQGCHKPSTCKKKKKKTWFLQSKIKLRMPVTPSTIFYLLPLKWTTNLLCYRMIKYLVLKLGDV